MVDFDKLDSDTLQDTFRLLDDFNEEGFNWRDMNIFSQPADEYIENFFSRKKQKSRTDKLFSSFPSFASSARSSVDADAKFADDVFSFTKNRFRRSESSYSTTSGYETSSSNETISEEVNDRRKNSSSTPSQSNYSSRCSTPSKSKYSPSSSASTPLKYKYSPSSSASTPFKTYNKQRERTYSQRNDSDLSKRLENKFMKDERHSVPHEIYSDCPTTPEDHERPHSVPVHGADVSDSDSNSSLRYFPSISMNSSRDSLCSEPLDRFMSRLSSFSSGSSRASSVVQDDPYSSPRKSQQEYSHKGDNPSKLESNSSSNLPDVLKGDPNGPQVRNVPIAMPHKEKETWTEKQGRIEDALKWLRSELVGLRAQDKVLLSQLKRCHDTIEDLKKQRSQNPHSEDDEEDGHWEDWEIAEFEKRYAENPELAEDLFNLKAKKTGTPIKQDIEAAL
ncbi:uncharacterized protein [Mytilus edulis]|uniref:uncharacterized protein n=1 Tax=Mytilus edulis TaxID=6550 RepID=UPI0039EE9E7E